MVPFGGGASKAALLGQLRSLAEDMPDLSRYRPLRDDDHRWLGRAAALVAATGNVLGASTIRTATKFLPASWETSSATIATTLYEAIAAMELEVPDVATGSHIPAGGAFSAVAAVGKAVTPARSDVLFMDAYANYRLLSDFAVLVPEGVTVRVLACSKNAKADLKPAVDRWRQQYADKRPLEARLAPAGLLHDRWIVVDGAEVWQLGQSFNALATRAFTTITKVVEPEVRQLNLEAVATMWGMAKPMS